MMATVPHQIYKTLPWLVIFAALLGFACDPEVEEEISPSDERDAGPALVYDGEEVVNFDETEALGVVSVFFEGQCTGTLLSNRVILTSRHCATEDHTREGPVIDPADYPAAITLETNDGPRIANAIHIVAKPLEGNYYDYDVALVVLEEPLEVNGDQTDFINTIHPGANSALETQTLPCYGYGTNPIDAEENILLKKWLRVADVGLSVLVYEANNQGEIPYNGHSGGTCFLYESVSSPVITGVLSGGDGHSVMQTAPESYRDWANHMSSVKPYASAIIIPPTGQVRLGLSAINTPEEILTLENGDRDVPFAGRPRIGGWYELEILEKPRDSICRVFREDGPIENTVPNAYPDSLPWNLNVVCINLGDLFGK